MNTNKKGKNYPIKVLFVLGGLKRGGSETWAVQILEKINRNLVKIDFLVHNRGGVYETKVISLGSKIYYCPYLTNPLKYQKELFRVLLKNGPYDVIHSNLQLYSGYILYIAKKAHVPCRIAHARNSHDGKSLTIFRKIYQIIMRLLIIKNATDLLAVSNNAEIAVFGKKTEKRGNCKILTGINLKKYLLHEDKFKIRKMLKITNKSFVIGHIGSFRFQKNHSFLIEIAKEVIKINPNSILLLIGDGKLREKIEKKVKLLGIEKNCRFLLERDDTSKLLQVMNIFVFPSFYEGFPRVLLEAQAAGIPCITSTSITKDISINNKLVKFISLKRESRHWANEIIKSKNGFKKINRKDIIQGIKDRGLSIEDNISELLKIYNNTIINDKNV